MERKKRMVIIITIVLSVIELLCYFVAIKQGFINFLSSENVGLIISFLGYATPAGLIYLLNYYIFAPIIYKVVCITWYMTGHYERISKDFDECVKKCINWLIQSPMHWGSLYTSTVCQNANTCECLLALKKSKYDARYKTIYDNARKELLKNVTNKGLQSKSLKYETVVCTSMVLYLLALEKNSGYYISNELNEKFEEIASNLWECRSNRGWGVYVDKLDEQYSCVANTFWALLALNNYSIAKTKEYAQFVESIFEYSNNSLFGFIIGDSPRLCTTSMAVILYFSLEDELKQKINQVFDIDAAINYIFKTFCLKNIQCETESLRGIDLKCHGSKKAPWTHMTMGFAMEALNLAFKNKKISIIKMDIYIYKLRTMCKKKVVNLTEQNQCYFIPKGMEITNNGVFTFPTAYFIMGLSYFVNGD